MDKGNIFCHVPFLILDISVSIRSENRYILKIQINCPVHYRPTAPLWSLFDPFMRSVQGANVFCNLIPGVWWRWWIWFLSSQSNIITYRITFCMCQRRPIGAIQQDSTWCKEIYVQQRLDLNYIHQYIRESWVSSFSFHKLRCILELYYTEVNSIYVSTPPHGAFTKYNLTP